MNAIGACSLKVTRQFHAEFGADCGHLAMQMVGPAEAEHLGVFQILDAKIGAHGERMVGWCDDEQSLAKQGLDLRGAALDRQQGSLVTSNLLIQGGSPRKVVGMTCSTFIATLGLAAFTTATVGLLRGRIAVAPLVALVAKRVSAKPLFILVGFVLTITSIYGVLRALVWP